MEQRNDILTEEEAQEKVLSIEELAPEIDELISLLDEKK